MADPLSVTFAGEPPRPLRKRESQNSLASEDESTANSKKDPKPKPKEVNWVTKGKAKVRDAKAVCTDSRCLRRTIEQKQKDPETQKHLDYKCLLFKPLN